MKSVSNRRFTLEAYRGTAVPRTDPKTLGELLYWSYANLAMMTVVVEDGVERPNTGERAPEPFLTSRLG